MESDPYDIADKNKPKRVEGYVYAVLDILYFLGLTLISLPLGITSAIMSVLTVILYRYDKRAAEQGGQRIPNTTLHLASLLGGWPGALIARPLLRHKLNQKRFRGFFWASIVANFGILYLLIAYLPPYNPLTNF